MLRSEIYNFYYSIDNNDVPIVYKSFTKQNSIPHDSIIYLYNNKRKCNNKKISTTVR